MPDVVNRLVDFILSVLGLFKCWTVVDQYEGGVRLRLGKHRGNLGPGFHVMTPLYIDAALTTSVVPGTYYMEEQSLSTKDGQEVVISVATQYRVTDPAKYLLEVEDMGTVLLPIRAEISRVVQQNTWADIQAMDLGDHLVEFALYLEDDYGVEVMDVVPVDTVSAMSIRLFSAASLQDEE